MLVFDNVIPDYAVPFSEAYGGPQFIARAFLEVRSFFSGLICLSDARFKRRVIIVSI